MVRGWRQEIVRRLRPPRRDRAHAAAVTRSAPELERLLAEADWLARLCRGLAGERGDDVAQATWLEALRQAPAAIQSPRAWLTTLARRQAYRMQRGAKRRQRREHDAAIAATHAEEPADVVARAEQHAELTAEVLRLPEPYRRTLLWRYFDQFDIDAIAARTPAPRNTVRSWLQRGLDLLRERLDQSPGGRDRWVSGIALLAARRGTSTLLPMASAVPVVATVLTMKKTVAIAAAAAALLLAGRLLLWPPQSLPPTPDPVSNAIVAATPPTVAGTADSERERAVVAEPASPPAFGRGERRVVDAAGGIVARVRMRARSDHAVRWQGGDTGWISGERSLRILPADELRLASDATHAASFFAQFTHPDEWRATVLGEPLPARETASDDRGVFAFTEIANVADGAITVADPARVLLESGATGTRPWRIGTASRVRGRVQDSSGQPIASAFVRALTLTNGEAAALPEQPEMRSDGDGVFLVRRAHGGGLLRVRAEGRVPAVVALADLAEQDVVVTLAARTPAEQWQVAGTVVDGGGQPIADAAVWFGRVSTKTGRDGQFAFATDEPKPQYALTVVAAGFEPWQRDNLGALLQQQRDAGLGLVVPLRGPTQSLRGLVLGANGAPAAGVEVRLLDPTLLDLTFAAVEERTGAYERAILTGADGTFVLPGLARRSYRLQATDPTTGATVVSPPLTPNAADALLRLPALRRDLRGRVVDAGKPLANATIAIAWCMHVTRGGGTWFANRTPVAADAEGRFELLDVPPQHCWLAVGVGNSVVAALPVEALPTNDSEVAIDIAAPRWLQLVAGAQPAARLVTFELGDGSIVASVGGASELGVDGSFAPIPLPATAVAVWLDHDTPGARRLELTDDRAVLLRMR
jgi:RNA polymerase sigma factor (sigma-70 family)